VLYAAASDADNCSKTFDSVLRMRGLKAGERRETALKPLDPKPILDDLAEAIRGQPAIDVGLPSPTILIRV